ncbi:MAG: hypothetical protein KBD46_03050 [Candidatus Levybacteria bacterium]|nr:hypothetical protein [Candidatus Levybacteria bacterium]
MDKPRIKKKRSLWLIVLSIILLTGLGYFMYTYNPKSILPNPFSLYMQPVSLFFVLLFLSITSLGMYIFNHTRRGILLGLFLCCYLLLRLNHLTDVYFALILLALFVSLELFFTRYQ